MFSRLRNLWTALRVLGSRLSLRILLVSSICSLAIMFAQVIPRASSMTPVQTPSAGTLSPTNKSITYTGGPFLIPTNSTDSAAGPVDCDQINPCEDFALTVDIPQDYKDSHSADVIRVEVSWNDASGG